MKYIVERGMLIISLFCGCLVALIVIHQMGMHRDESIEMVLVEGGLFEIGERIDEEHLVVVDSFYMGTYEVTQKEWNRVMESNPSKWIGKNLPVHRVSWVRAVKFCNMLSEKEGFEPVYTEKNGEIVCDFSKDGYRLPTEAEWEFAARGGNFGQNYKYAGSDNPEKVAWFFDGKSMITNDYYMHPVGKKKPNELGLYDMSGNASERCWDWYDSDYFKKCHFQNKPVENPYGPETGNERIIRGGSYGSDKIYIEVSDRLALPPDLSVKARYMVSLGLRLTRSFIK